MNRESTQSRTLSSVLDLPPGEILHWISNAGAEDSNIFPWASLAEFARQRASVPKNTLGESIAWGRVSEMAHVKAKKGLANSFSLDHAMMNLRALLIRRYGVSSDEDLLSSGPLIDWFNSLMPASPEEVANSARNWNKLPPQQVLVLRHIKNAISVLEMAFPANHALNQPAVAKLLEQWRPVAGLLP